MYLSKKTYVKNWEHMKPEEKTKVSIKRNGKSIIDTKRVSYVVEEVAYWRKANQIHDWFVKNVQDGDDDCKDYHVSSEQLEELLDTINKVIEASELVEGKINNGKRVNEKGAWENIEIDGKTIKDSTVARELLPCAEGFFFGATDYDEYYINDLQYTKEVVEKLLSEDKKSGLYPEYEYTSSW